MPERVQAAAATGWNGIGLIHTDLQDFRNSHGLRRLKAILDDNGIERVELEFITDWWAHGAARAASDKVRRLLFEAAEFLEVPYVKVLPDRTGNDAPPLDLYREFEALADEAARFNTKVAIEYMPFAGNIRTVQDALELVTTVSHPAGGIVADIWHTSRGGTPYSDLRRISLEVGVDITDQTPQQLTDDLIAVADRVIVLGREAQVRPVDGTPVEYSDTDEPSERGIDGIDRMRLVRDDINRRVHNLAGDLTAVDSGVAPHLDGRQ